MYSQLKAIMKANGYKVSDGEGWSPSDVEQFIAFGKYVLGAHSISPNQLLAYPHAFPKFIAAIEALHDGGSGLIVPTEPDVVASSAPIDPPAEVPAFVPATEVADDVLDVSGGTPSGEPVTQPEVIEPVVEAPAEAPAEAPTETPAEDLGVDDSDEGTAPVEDEAPADAEA